MKTSRLENFLQQFNTHVITEKYASEEVELGFDTMLSHEIIQFLTANHSTKSLSRRVKIHQNGLFVLDEHELAMV